MGFVMSSPRWLPRDSLPDSLMGSCLVEVLLVPGDKPKRMPVSKDDHVVENLPSGAADKSFSDGVPVGDSHRSLDHPEPHTLGDTVERCPELVIAIAQQNLRRFSLHCCISRLLGSPLLGRAPASCGVDDFA